MLDHRLSPETQDKLKKKYAESNRKFKQKMILKYGSWEAYIDFLREKGRKGGRLGGRRFKKGDPEASQIGKLGAKKRWENETGR